MLTSSNVKHHQNVNLNFASSNRNISVEYKGKKLPEVVVDFICEQLSVFPNNWKKIEATPVFMDGDKGEIDP